MKPSEVLAAWVEALEGEQYEQGAYVLHEGDEFCCLGVLCELGRVHGVVHEVTVHDEDRAGPRDLQRLPQLFRYDGEEVFPPPAVQEWSGLNREQMLGLVEMNDSGEYSFAEIAQYIRKNYIREDD